MSGWQVGDLALYLGDGEWLDEECRPTTGPGVGFIGEVLRVVPTMLHGVAFIGLGFAPWAGDEYDADLFTKINPLTDDETREFEADLRHDQREPIYLGEGVHIITRRLDL